MIRYTKGAPPARLTSLAATPGMTWAGLGAPDREPIRTALIRDQGGLCAYCQRRISLDTDPTTGRSQMKIEHWTPRATSDEHHLTWSNLLGVCMGTSMESADTPGHVTQHCDSSRGNQPLFLHPVEGRGPDPTEHLRYTKNGNVEAAAPDVRVDGDIRALNLNARRLVRGRAAVLDIAWKRLERSAFAIGELRKFERANQIVAGTAAPEHAEFLRYHIRRKIRRLGHAP
jgi:uncharacterized protein (TIGR02646 family)